MACSTCQNSNSISFPNTHYRCPDCDCVPQVSSCDPCGSDTIDSSKIKYTGAALTCIDLEAGATQEEINQALDAKICEELGTDISGLDTSCLVNPDDSQIATISEFIEAASDYMCTTRTTYNTFVTNYNTYVTNTTQQIITAGVPGITGACIGIIPTDTNAQAFTKTNTAICSIQAAINPSTANWNNCGFSVGSAPTTMLGGFNKVLDYICQVKNLIPASVTLPVFNNVGSCLPGTLTTTDTLVSTVNKLKQYICTGVNYSFLNYGCVDGATQLDVVLQNMLDRMNLMQVYAFNPTYFSLTNVDDDFPCLGQNITLNPTGLDKKVGSNGSDGSPGYLSDKLQAGAGIAFDYSTTPGKVITSATGDHKVLVNGSDGSPDYLDTKIDGTSDGSGALTLTATSNGGNTKVIITPTIDYNILATRVLNIINGDPTLYSLFESMVCGVDCELERTVQIQTYNPEGNRSYTVTLAQNTPSVALYDSGAVIALAGTTTSSAPLAVTSVETNPVFTITYLNTAGGSAQLHIYTKDPLGNIVSGSTDITTTVSGGAIYTAASYAVGTSTTQYIIHVDVV